MAAERRSCRARRRSARDRGQRDSGGAEPRSGLDLSGSVVHHRDADSWDDGGHTDVSLWYLLRGDSSRAIEFDRGEFHSVRWFGFDEIPFERSDPHMRRFVSKLRALSPPSSLNGAFPNAARRLPSPVGRGSKVRDLIQRAIFSVAIQDSGPTSCYVEPACPGTICIASGAFGAEAES